MLWEDKRVGNDDVFSPCSSKNNDLRNIIGSQRFHTPKVKLVHDYWFQIPDTVEYLLVNLVCLRLVAVKSHNRELRLNLTRVNLNNPDPSRNELLPQCIRKASDSSFGGTVNTTAGVGFPAGDGPDVDDVSSAAVRSLLENW